MSKIYKRNCDKCGKFYIGGGEKYCSFSCSNKATYNMKKEKLIKAHIGKSFFKKHTEEWKKASSEFWKGKRSGRENPHWQGGKPNCIDCGNQKGSWYGKRCMDCHFNFCRGENHPCWKGGTSERRLLMGQREYIIWRIAVFERDEYTCQECGQIGGKLHADHIKPWSIYPELRLAIDNGRTLCVECHRKTDTYGSKVWKLLNYV